MILGRCVGGSYGWPGLYRHVLPPDVIRPFNRSVSHKAAVEWRGFI